MKRLGEVLIEEKMLTQQQLKLALAEQKRTSELLGSVLVRLSLLTPKKLCQAVALKLELPCVDVSVTFVDPKAVQLVPQDVAEKFKLVPFGLSNGILQVAMNDPSDVVAVDTLRKITGMTIERHVGDLESIHAAIQASYGPSVSIDDEVEKNVQAAISGGVASGEVTAPIIRLIELFIGKAIRSNATDIHITPEELVTRVNFRVDGVLRTGHILPKILINPLVTRVKVMADMNIAEQRLPQDGAFSFPFMGRNIDIRISVSPINHGENLVLRILDKTGVILGLELLGLDEKSHSLIEKLILKPHGIILAAGPTGSGKTTTLFSMLRQLNAIEKNILTIEDPIEYTLPFIKQTQVNLQAGLTFDRAIRHFLRQDPDIILVGEIRDLETARIAVQAAMTGHLVLSTIHTNDCASTIARLMDLGVEPYLIPTSLRAVITQRLIRQVCPKCAEEYVPSAQELLFYDLSDWIGAGKVLKRARGCQHCEESGYRGRFGIFEIMEVTPRIINAISEEASTDTILMEAKQDRMKTLREDGLEKVLAGLTTLEEVCRVT